MNRQMTLGRSSVSFPEPVFIQGCASVVGQKEGEGPLGNCFDFVCQDPMFGMDIWEAAESTMQKQAALLAVQKAGLTPSGIRLLFAGDLLAQTVASSFGTADLGIPLIWEPAWLLPPVTPLLRISGILTEVLRITMQFLLAIWVWSGKNTA